MIATRDILSDKEFIQEEYERVKDELKKSEITEDQKADFEDKIQKLTDKYVAEIDKILENKEKEIMTI